MKRAVGRTYQIERSSGRDGEEIRLGGTCAVARGEWLQAPTTTAAVALALGTGLHSASDGNDSLRLFPVPLFSPLILSLSFLSRSRCAVHVLAVVRPRPSNAHQHPRTVAPPQSHTGRTLPSTPRTRPLLRGLNRPRAKFVGNDDHCNYLFHV